VTTPGDRPPGEGPPPEPAFADVASMLRAADATSVSAIRNSALVAVLAFGGLRVSAALALRERDVGAGFDRVRVTERDRVRVVELLEGAREPLGRWAAERASLDLDADAPFFCTMRGGALAPSYVRDAVTRLAERAGIRGGVSAEASAGRTSGSCGGAAGRCAASRSSWGTGRRPTRGGSCRGRRRLRARPRRPGPRRGSRRSGRCCRRSSGRGPRPPCRCRRSGARGRCWSTS
jgi:hypothetical protein